MTDYLLLAQGIYYLLTGIWPLVSIGSFQKVTGPKTDLWLVKMVAALIVVIGSVLIAAGWRGHSSEEVVILAIGSAIAFLIVDVFYALRGVIAQIYLGDAIAELGILIAWLIRLG